MAKKPSRTKINESHLSPDSGIKVFKFINQLLEEHELSTEFFKSRIYTFNAFEQYFICRYCQLYFNNKGSDIYLYKWLEQQRAIYDDNDEPELFDNIDVTISKNQQELLNIIPHYKKIAEKRAKDLIRFNIPEWQYSKHFDDHPINCKIPLLYKPSSFRLKFFDIWQGLYTKSQVEEMFSNIFQLSGINEDTKALYLDVDKKMLVREQMTHTYKEYKSMVERQNEKVILRYKEYLMNQDEFRSQFYKTFEYEKVLRYSFAHALYNCFPHFRDLYREKSIKNPSYTKEAYFENTVKNFSLNRSLA